MIIIVNLFFPGVGTIIASCLGTHGGAAICVGILQLCLFPVLIGWIWALCWGLELRKRAIHKGGDGRGVDEEQGAKRGSSHEEQDHYPGSPSRGGQKEYVTPPPPVSHQLGSEGMGDTHGIPSAPYPSDHYSPQVPPAPPLAPPM